ncbi:hypothetical protein DAEQUDRAFT_723371 [Daedalea quercina L-15889]|uniref:Uncharacterized protein n=1 Tax=Daedalea quercina L-15889 TaxID=1314783 RepID=A0A165SLT3_9APHY|nr:hypothetical protein DAEQUDRAFT_723371 [Daedalea quercina L-15889]
MGRQATRLPEQLPQSAPVTVLSNCSLKSTESPTVANVKICPASIPGSAVAASVTPTNTVNVDHIIELIVQRIDRRSSRGLREDDVPPRYPECRSVMNSPLCGS